MDTPDVVLPASPLSQVGQPAWLVPTIQILHGITAVTRWKLPSTLAVVYALYSLIYYQIHRPAGDYLDVYIFGDTLISAVWTTCNDLLFRNAEDFTRIRPAIVDGKNDGNVKSDKHRRSLWQQFLDALEIGFAATRGVGWKYQRKITTKAPSPSYPRWKFVTQNIFSAAWRMLALDLGSMYIRSTPLGTLPVTRFMQDEPLHVGLLKSLLLFTMARWFMDLLYRLAAAASVGFGMHRPEVWPNLFGSLKEAHTVRRFWAHSWHQMMRNVAEPPVNFLARDVFQIPPRSYLSNYFKVLGAFFVAYVVHGYGTRMAGGSHVGDWNYFMSQAVAIWLEESVVAVVLKTGIVGEDWVLAKPIGYVWTALFTAYTVMFWQDHAATGGAYVRPAFGISPVELLLERFS